MVNKTKEGLIDNYSGILGEWEKPKIIPYLIDAEARHAYNSIGHDTGQTDLDKFVEEYKKEDYFRHGIRSLLVGGIKTGLLEKEEVKKVFDFADYRDSINREINYDNYCKILLELKEEAQNYLSNYFTSSSKVPPTA